MPIIRILIIFIIIILLTIIYIYKSSIPKIPAENNYRAIEEAYLDIANDKNVLDKGE